MSSTVTTSTTPVSRPDALATDLTEVDGAVDPSNSPGWVPVVRIIVGVCIVLAGLWWSWQRFATLGHGEYVYTMFGYMLVMMLGGGLLANGVITIFKELKGNILSSGGTDDHTDDRDGQR